MIDHHRKTSRLADCIGSWYQLNVLIALFVTICIVSGCISPPLKQLYENPEAGISLEQPENWSLEFYKRSGFIFLEADKGEGNKESARIEINGYGCNDTTFNTPEEDIEANIDRIRHLYYLGSALKIIQEPIKVETGDHEVAKAIIAIPTMSLSEDEVINQVGDRGPDIFQTIEMFAIRDSDRNFIMVYLYKGNREELNTEAEEIVDSIQITCSTKP